MTPATRRSDRLDQASVSHPAMETGASLWIEHSEINYNIRRLYTSRQGLEKHVRSSFRTAVCFGRARRSGLEYTRARYTP
jgi:hypothetical protein